MRARVVSAVTACLLILLALGLTGCRNQVHDKEPREEVSQLSSMLVNAIRLPNIDASGGFMSAVSDVFTTVGDFEITFAFRHEGGLGDGKGAARNVIVEFSTSGLKDVAYRDVRACTMICNGDAYVTNSKTAADTTQNWTAKPAGKFHAPFAVSAKAILSDAQATVTVRRMGDRLSVTGTFTRESKTGTWSASVEEHNLPDGLTVYIGGDGCRLSDVQVVSMKGGVYLNGSDVNNVHYAETERYLEKIQGINAAYDMPKGNDTQLAGVKNVRLVGFLTGEVSANKTESRFQLCGTDVGVPIVMNDTIYYLFGDTFFSPFDRNWINNCIAWSRDLDYTDGLTIDGMQCEEIDGMARVAALFLGQRIDHVEYSKIPTGGIAIGDTLYASYMSVRTWGGADEWWCNYGSIAKSEDAGRTWTLLEHLKWPGDRFGLLYPVIDGAWVYVWGTPGGRKDPAYLMRVPLDRYEDLDAYAYYTGVGEDGEPVFEKGREAIERCEAIIPGHVGEISAMYSPYLGEWLVAYASGMNIVLRTAKNPWPPYSDPMVLASSQDFALYDDYMRLYCPYMHPTLTTEGGRKVAFMMSHFKPVYNVMVMEMELVKITR